jgi:hypothetical protein
LYIPGALLKPGDNSIMVIESYKGSNILRFTSTPDYGPVSTTEAVKENPLDIQINMV